MILIPPLPLPLSDNAEADGRSAGGAANKLSGKAESDARHQSNGHVHDLATRRAMPAKTEGLQAARRGGAAASNTGGEYPRPRAEMFTVYHTKLKRERNTQLKPHNKHQKPYFCIF